MNITYRPEVDGLRAIAVVSVILYHAQITIFGYQPFKGGFIGVDIFFVISGYLITSIILKELAATGSFSFKNFYERRARRILPALLFLMLVSLPFAWKYLLPNNFIDLSKSILYSLGFSSNIYFWLTGREYGAASEWLKPFLHTWSLSVEEQYYIFFPIILFFIFKYFKNYLIHILLIGFSFSLVFADWGSRNYPSLNFYILPTRGWELLAGSILAYLEITSGFRNKNRTLSLLLPSVGLILIVYSIFFFHDKMFHPSFYTLFPIIGVCLIIWFSNKGELITKILSTRLFVGIGLISYSLYLWHYTIFAFARITDFTQDSFLNKLLLPIIILVLSVFSYYCIEKPFRNKNYKFKLVFTSIFISVFFLTFFNFYIIKKNGFYNRLPQILRNNLIVKKIDCNFKNSCKFKTASKNKIHLIGDSHMRHISYNLFERVKEKNYQFFTHMAGGCLYFPGFNLINLKNKKISDCNNSYFQNLKKQLLQEKNSILIFGGYYTKYLSEYTDNKKSQQRTHGMKYVKVGNYETIQESFKNEIYELSKKNKIILVYPIPEAFYDVPHNIFLQMTNKKNKFFIDFSNLKKLTTSYDIYKKRSNSSFELLDAIQGKNIHRVYPHTLFCKKTLKKRCATHDDKNLFYIDDNHLSLKGSVMLNDLIMKEIEKIELKFD